MGNKDLTAEKRENMYIPDCGCENATFGGSLDMESSIFILKNCEFAKELKYQNQVSTILLKISYQHHFYPIKSIRSAAQTTKLDDKMIVIISKQDRHLTALEITSEINVSLKLMKR
jgi:hypothetical protein